MTGQMRKLSIMAVMLVLAACASPALRLDERARQLGFVRQTVEGLDYRHVVFRNAADGGEGILHVYLEGDGVPWLTPYRIAADPTPRDPLALELMALDSAPSLYLGRPCYHGQAEHPPCHPLLWTARRYGPEVVDSMATALRKILGRAHYDGLVLIGYSGGGTLAMLLAERLPETQAVVTIAGNLDPPHWAELHGYSPLPGSLNPVARPPLRSDIAQLHFAGGRDGNVPANLIHFVVSQQHCAKFIIINTFDHICCWRGEWSRILSQWHSVVDFSGDGTGRGRGCPFLSNLTLRNKR